MSFLIGETPRLYGFCFFCQAGAVGRQVPVKVARLVRTRSTIEVEEGAGRRLERLEASFVASFPRFRHVQDVPVAQRALKAGVSQPGG